MNGSAAANTGAIVLDEIFPHKSDVIWKALTDSTIMSRWLMPPSGFEPVVGNRFTFQTKPAGEWDGTIHCEVLEVIPHVRLTFAWRGGHAANIGYGSKLDTAVTFTLSTVDGGTRLRLEHSGFVLPKNEVAYTNMSQGWNTVLKRLDNAITSEEATAVSH